MLAGMERPFPPPEEREPPGEREPGEREPTDEPVDLRAYRPDDHEALVRFYVEFEPKRAAQGLPPAGEDRVRRWLSSVTGAGTHLVALRSGRLIGHAFVVPTTDPGTGEYAVFVGAAERGRGIGTRLNLAGVEAARAAGVRRLWLSAEPRNRAAIRSYEKAGFRFRPETIYSPELEMEMEL
jgi:RimJ/RimL family protein N-acetyltransferase